MTDEAEAIVLRRAKASDIDDIAAIYRSCIGIAGTTWNEYYPLRRDAERDLAVNGLYVAEVGGTTVGCVSVIRSELEALAGWRMRGDGVLELSRLAVRPDRRGHGYAADIISAVTRSLKTMAAPPCICLPLAVTARRSGPMKSLDLSFAANAGCMISIFICTKSCCEGGSVYGLQS